MQDPTPGLLANALADVAKASPRLLVKISQFNAFDEYVADKTFTKRHELLIGPVAHNFRFVAGDFPIGMHRIPLEDSSNGTSLKIRENWVYIYNSLNCLLDDGYGFFIVEPAFWATDWKRFLEVLKDRGFFFCAAFRFVNQLLPSTTLQPVCALFSKREPDSLFVAEIDNGTPIVELATAFRKSRSGDSLSTGLNIAPEEFRGFDQLRIEREISVLETQYKSYKQFRLIPDLASPDCVVLCKTGSSHTEVENAIYIPRIGSSDVVAELSSTKLKHQNYIQVKLNPSLVINEYLSIYFRSYLGKLSLRALTQGLFIKHLTKASLYNVPVPVPSLEQQKVILNAQSSLLKLESTLSGFRDELSLNPKSAATINDSLDSMLKQVNRLSQSDEIRALIRHGESRTLEFKETLTLDVRKGSREKYIEAEVLKTIAAFLNSQGGTLLVGITDAGEPVGLTRELDKFFKSSRDEFLKHFKNIVRRSIGPNFYPLLDYELDSVDGEPMLRVDCQPSDEPCFIDSIDFYVRTNPATDKLDGQDMLEYVQRRFHK